jgi:4-amino-4-deoxy-L-arabinose transferase-like glycosyltransferase
MDLKRRAAEVASHPRFLFAVIAIILFGFLGDRSLWGSEGRWSEAARWMQLSGDYLTSRLNGAPWLAKPPMSYWVILPFSIHGVSEFSSRVPSVFGALLAIYAIMKIARLWGVEEAGRLAAAILLSTYLFTFWARTAAGDMPTVGCVTLSVLFIERFRRCEKAHWLYALAALCAFSSQLKGLLGIALPWVSLFALVIADHGRPGRDSWPRYKGELTRLWCRGHLMLSALLFIILYLAPFIAERLIAGHWQSLHQAYLHTVQRALGNLDHTSNGPFFYGYTIFVLAAPWSLWLLAGPFKAQRRTVCWFFAILLFFTASSSRRSYYLLPILPPCALMIAEAYLSLKSDVWFKKIIRYGTPGLIFVVSVAALPTMFFLESLIGDQLAAGSLPHVGFNFSMLLILAFSCAFSLRAECRGKREQSAIYLSLGLVLGTVFTFWVVFPCMEKDRSLRRFGLAIKRKVKAEERLELYGRRRAAALFFYIGRQKPIAIALDAKAVSKSEGLLLIRPIDYKLLVTNLKWKRQIEGRFEVILRERQSADEDLFGTCRRCQRRSRRRGCKHYLLLKRRSREER